jgi:hypothetical protein
MQGPVKDPPPAPRAPIKTHNWPIDNISGLVWDPEIFEQKSEQ